MYLNEVERGTVGVYFTDLSWSYTRLVDIVTSAEPIFSLPWFTFTNEQSLKKIVKCGDKQTEDYNTDEKGNTASGRSINIL